MYERTKIMNHENQGSLSQKRIKPTKKKSKKRID